MDKDKKIIELKNLVEAAEISLQQARKILVDLCGTEEEKMIISQARQKGNISQEKEGQIIEGIFDGQNMVGPDGKKYSVPANYASKSKLVEGDKLKLTITNDGSFLYKQINLLERDRIIGDLIMDDEAGEFRVLANNKSYKVLNASITYFKGEVGNKVTLLVPAGRESSWAAVENIFKAGEEQPLEATLPSSSSELTSSVAEVDNSESKTDGNIEDVKSQENNKKAPALLSVETKEDEVVEDKKDEFLSHDADVPTGISAEKPLEENSIEKANVKDEDNADKPPTDIFAATEQIDTHDVKQVETPLEDQLAEKSAGNSPVNTLEQNSDSQGLDPI